MNRYRIRKNLPWIWIALFIILCMSKHPMLIMNIGMILVTLYLLDTHFQQKDFARLITMGISTVSIFYHHATDTAPPYAMVIGGVAAAIYTVLTIAKLW